MIKQAIFANPCGCRERERERERESYILDETSANEVSAIDNGCKIAKAMYSIYDTMRCLFCRA